MSGSGSEAYSDDVHTENYTKQVVLDKLQKNHNTFGMSILWKHTGIKIVDSDDGIYNYIEYVLTITLEAYII